MAPRNEGSGRLSWARKLLASVEMITRHSLDLSRFKAEDGISRNATSARAAWRETKCDAMHQQSGTAKTVRSDVEIMFVIKDKSSPWGSFPVERN